MTALSEGVAIGSCSPGVARQERLGTRENWCSYAHRRLTQVFKRAAEVPFDHSTRLVFMSDCHRGDGSRADGFARNHDLYLHVLRRYYDQGFVYIEVGDGDELWKSWRFEDIRRAHGPVFELLHRFDHEERLHLIAGNHDRRNGRGRADLCDKDGMAAREGLILHHTRTGQRLFVVHGHQADLKSDHLSRVSRLAVGYIWRPLQLLGLVEATSQMGHIWKLKRIERTIMSWAEAHQQIMICGHTHRPMVAVHGEVAYFNAGSCVFPGCLTALELVDGEISLVSWGLRNNGWRPSLPRLERQLVAPPQKLNTLP